MYIDVTTNTYVAHFLRNKYGADPYNLDLQQNGHIRHAFTYWGLNAFEIPAPAEVSGTFAIIRLEWPDGKSFFALGKHSRDLQHYADRSAADMSQRNFFYREFWFSCHAWVEGQLAAGEKEINAIRTFMQTYGLTEDVISEDSIVRQLHRDREKMKTGCPAVVPVR